MKTSDLPFRIENNFRDLANYLRDLPEDYPHFNMSQFCAIPDSDDVEHPRKYIEPRDIKEIFKANYVNYENPLTECGTVACALGHAPFAIDVDPSKFGSWRQFASCNFGFDLHEREMEWCFGWKWYKVDNTPAGAAARIYWFLEHGVPVNFQAMMSGTEPLCYKV